MAKEEGQPESGGGYASITDILRARLIATSPTDMKIKIGRFEAIPGVKIIQYKPKFSGG